MGFFDAFRRILEASSDERGDRGDPRLAETGGLGADLVNDSAHPEYPDGKVVAADPARMAAPPDTSAYDRDQWRKKLTRILARLPASQAEWAGLMTDAGALNLDTAWVEHRQREEFTMMVRRAVSDRTLTLQESAALEQARILIGLPDEEAEAILRRVVAEAEAFFDQPVEGVRPARAEAGP